MTTVVLPKVVEKVVPEVLQETRSCLLDFPFDVVADEFTGTLLVDGDGQCWVTDKLNDEFVDDICEVRRFISEELRVVFALLPEIDLFGLE